LDRSSRPYSREGYCAYDAWFKCRAIREQLLAAIAEEDRAAAARA
jgi:hypothetical protein